MGTRVTGAELDFLRDALRHWQDKLVARLPDPIIEPLALATLRHRHNSIAVAACLGLPDLADVFATKGKP